MRSSLFGLYTAAALLACAACPTVSAQTFHERLAAMPEASWARVNTNRFEDAWRLNDQAPTPAEGDVIGRPKGIIAAWSSMAWDSRRGDVIIWGGGHANYAGNEIYRWRSSTLRWQIASLPSQVAKIPPLPGYYETVDGIFNAPIAAHTYDNSEYLPNVDRFITFGGAAWNSGIYWEDRTGSFKTGPYVWNPALAHPDRVGGAAGSHANPALYPNVAAGAMWDNRNNLAAGSNVVGDYPGASFAGFINGGSAYHNDNGRDVLYVCDFDLWRYTIGDIGNPALDRYEKVGRQAIVSGQGPGAYDPVRKLFVKIYGGTRNFVFWNLNTAGPANLARFAAISTPGAAFNFADMGNYGLDFDSLRNHFTLWGGFGDVWKLTPPADPLTQAWVLEPLARAASIEPNRGTLTTFNGVLGKWKYVREYDVFLGLYEPFAGDIWVYKPSAWRPQANLAADRSAPQVNIVSPVAASSITGTVAVTVSVSDTSPILSVNLYAGGRLVGTDTSAPYQFALASATLNPGRVALRAQAQDSANNTAFSDAVWVSVARSATVQLNVTKTGTGAGTVTSAPAGIQCGADCGEAFTNGTRVTLTASPAAGSTFTAWSGACSGTGACTVSMDAAKTLTASFAAASATPSVTLTRSVALATETGPTASVLTFTRSGPTSTPLLVRYTATGSATAGSDYVRLPGNITIPSGAASVSVALTPINDTLIESRESVTVSLASDPAYTLGTARAVSVGIVDNDTVVRITASDASATEAGLGAGSFTVTRTGYTGGALIVRLLLGGSATRGVDYRAPPASIVIPIGASSTVVTIAPLDDTLREVNEIVTATLAADPAYTRGTVGAVSITISSNE